MTTEIKNWLLNEYASVGKNLQIDSVMGAINDTIKEIKEKQLFDKRINVSKNISVLVYESGTVEVHVSIDGVLSTYKSFKESKLQPITLQKLIKEEGKENLYNFMGDGVVLVKFVDQTKITNVSIKIKKLPSSWNNNIALSLGYSSNVLAYRNFGGLRRVLEFIENFSVLMKIDFSKKM